MRPSVSIRHLVFLILLVAGQALTAQSDTAFSMLPVEIKAAKINKYSVGSHIQAIDSQLLTTYGSASLTELLSRQTGIFFKSYGLGSLATAGFRGSGASHTSILWNGFNLQNPMNGVMDFALFPVSMVDEIKVQHGGGGTLQGSGSLGGAVFLENNLRRNVPGKVTLNTSLGSFHELGQTGNLSIGGKSNATSAGFFFREAKNDFPIAASDGVNQQDARTKQWGIHQNNLLKISEQQQLKSFFWYQQADRQIPPSRTESNSHARQQDDACRLGLEWSKITDHNVAKARAGYFEEGILFFTDLVDSSQSRSRTWIGEVEQAVFFRKSRVLRVGLHGTRQTATTRETGFQERNRLAAYASWQHGFWKEKLAWTLEGRQEWVDGKFIPIVVSTGAELQLSQPWKLTGRISKNYNLPTFNDLYWQEPFAKGNPNLKPETAWGEEIGIQRSQLGQNMLVQARLTAFHNWVENWIVWTSAGGIFKPENRRSVRSRGLEIAMQTKLKQGEWQLFTYLNWALTRSTVERIYQEDMPSLLGKQLIYTPVSNGNLGFLVSFKSIFLNYGHVFTGKRFTTTDNSDSNSLPAYQIGSLKLGKGFRLEPFQFQVQVAVENLLNETYEVIAARPMPGRYYRLEMKIQI